MTSTRAREVADLHFTFVIAPSFGLRVSLRASRSSPLHAQFPLVLAWITWRQSSFELPPQKLRAILLFCGLLSCTLSVVVFWSQVLDNLSKIQGGGAEEICDFLNTFATIAGFWKGASAAAAAASRPRMLCDVATRPLLRVMNPGWQAKAPAPR
jgi:hypothetical protein